MWRQHKTYTSGFTMVELVMIILLLAIISISVATRWPTGMDSRAAALEFQRALRFAQHMAITREWSGNASSWGITVSGNRYYIGRADANCISSSPPCADSECADETMCNRSLLGDSSMTITSGGATAIFFNGLGEPINNTSGNVLPSTVFVIDSTESLTVCAETGYVMEGNHCP